MLYIMRTTTSLDDQLAKQPAFRLVTVRGVHPRPGVNLDLPRALEAKDDETRFKNRQR